MSSVLIHTISTVPNTPLLLLIHHFQSLINRWKKTAQLFYFHEGKAEIQFLIFRQKKTQKSSLSMADPGSSMLQFLDVCNIPHYWILFYFILLVSMCYFFTYSLYNLMSVIS